MTINEYRNYLKSNAVDWAGMSWKFFEDDLVRIVDINDIYETKFKNFTNLDNSIQMSDEVKNKEITDIKVTRDERFHRVVLFLDIRHKDNKNKIESGISAKMKYL